MGPSQSIGRGWSMQWWAAMLVLGVTLPLGGLLVWNARSAAQLDEEASARRIEQIAAQMAAETDQFLDATRQLLTRISTRPQIRALDPRRCDALFSDFRAHFPRYANLLLLDARGGGICGHDGIVPGADAYAHLDFFRLLAGGAAFHVDRPRVGRTSKRWIVAVAVPVRDDAGAFAGVLALAIDLVDFPLPLLHTLPSSSGVSLDLVDRNGTFVARGSGRERIGTRAPVGLVDAVQGGRPRTAFTDADGIEYAAHLVPLANAPWVALARQPSQGAAAVARERLQQTLGAALVVLLAVWGAAALGVRRALRPLAEIARVATAVAEGDTRARVRDGGPREIAAIGEGFNRMLDQRAEAEAALRASEARYRALFLTSSDAIIGLDLDDRIVFANPAVETLTGWTPAELVGQSLAMLQPPDLREAHVRAIRRFAEGPRGGRRRRSLETQCLHRDGETLPVEITFSITEVAGQATFVGFLRDISERHAVLAELRESEQRFRAMADSSPVLIWMADADVAEFYFNATWLAFTGQSADEARRGGWIAGVHPDDLAAVQAAIARANQNREGCTLEYRRRRQDGEWRWLLDTSAPRRDPQGRFLGYAGTAVDIHDRVVAEGRIRRLTGLYSALSQANEAIARSNDLDSLLQRVCDVVVQQTGIRTAVVAMADDQRERLVTVAASGAFASYFATLSSPIGVAAAGEESPGSIAIREARTVVSNDRALDADTIRPMPNAAMRATLRSTAVFPLLRQHAPVGVLGVYAEPAGYFDRELTDLLDLLATDLSYALETFAARERRDLAEDALKRLNATLEERVAERTRSLEAANRELEAFTYSVSHDLRAPLRAIRGFSELLHEGYVDRLDDTGRNYLERVKAGSARMSRLIEDLLDLSRVARQAIHRTEVDLSSLAGEVVDELRESEPDRDITVTIAPDLVVTADPGLVRIVLRNLLDNAWKFTSHGVDARIDVVPGEIDGRPGVTVRDNGAGFDPAYADKLFAPFQRLHGEREFPGTGIGLAIVQRIVHRHGGEIRAFAAPGDGAAFTFTLGAAD